jgi:DNA invertase Pin-like site-specific DNA recombinase
VKDRPELAKAIAHAKRSNATLVIAKLDRLGRNVHFVSALMESSVDFVCCDNPNASRLTIHILAAIAEYEAKAISDRTKAALAAYKARGGRLGAARPGSHRLTVEQARKGGRIAGQAARKAAVDSYADIVEQMVTWRKNGLTQQAIADHLNTEGYTTRNGRPWNQVQVMRVLRRFMCTS